MRTIVHMVLWAVLLAGCAREQMDDCFTSTGPWVQELRRAPPAHTIELEDRIDLEILVDSSAQDSRILVDAGRRVLPDLVTEVRGEVLHISNRMRCNWVRNLERRPMVRVTLPALSALVYRGTGDVRATHPITGSTFRLEQWAGHGTVRLPLAVDTCWVGLHTGVGNAVVTGRVHTAYFYTSNFAHLDARDLAARQVLVNNSGSGDIRCRAEDAAYVQLREVGDVYLGGAPPVVDLQRSGTGRLVLVD